MQKQPITARRLTSNDEAIARRVFRNLLTLIQNQLGSFVDDLVQFALNTPGWWVVQNSDRHISFHTELTVSDIDKAISPGNRKFWGIGNNTRSIRLDFTVRDYGCVHGVGHVQFSIFLTRGITKEFKCWWDVYYDHPTYAEASYIMGGGIQIHARRRDRSFRFPGKNES